MIISTKFDLNQEVCFIELDSKTSAKTCNCCNNVGKITTVESNMTLECPKCHGRKLYNIVSNWVLDIKYNPGVIKSIIANVYDEEFKLENPDDNDMNYYTLLLCGDNTRQIDETNVFLNKDDAIAECVKRNTQIRLKELSSENI